MKLRLPVELPSFHHESEQPEPPHHLVPATGQQRSFGDAMVLLVWRAALWQIQGERDALLAAAKEAVVEER